jgi:hypothetical protein
MTKQSENTASGFAAAVLPITTSTRIETDSQGIDSGWVEIPVQGPDGLRIKGYRASPLGSDGWRRLQDWFRIHLGTIQHSILSTGSPS